MLKGAVVQHIVHDYANASFVRFFDQFIKIGKRAIVWLDVSKVTGGIAMVSVCAGCNGHEPNAFDAQVLQMIQRLNEAFQIANAIAVAVFVAAHKNFHERAVMPTLFQLLRLALHERRASHHDCQHQQTQKALVQF